MYICDRVQGIHRYARWIGRLSYQRSNLSCPHNLLQKVVIHVSLDTGFKGMQVVTYPANCQTTEVIPTKKFPKKGLGTCTWINKVLSPSWLYSCSVKGTDIAGVKGQWLINRPKCSVPENQMTALRLELAFLIYFPPQIAQEIIVTLFYDVMIICSTLLAGKPLCMHKGNTIIGLHICWHCCQNPQLLSLLQNHIIFSLFRISCLWHSPPGISVQPHTRVWNLFTTFTTFKDGHEHRHV